MKNEFLTVSSLSHSLSVRACACVRETSLAPNDLTNACLSSAKASKILKSWAFDA